MFVPFVIEFSLNVVWVPLSSILNFTRSLSVYVSKSLTLKPQSFNKLIDSIATDFTYLGNTTSKLGFTYKSLVSLSLFNSIFNSTLSFELTVDNEVLLIANVASVLLSSKLFAIAIVCNASLSSMFKYLTSP